MALQILGGCIYDTEPPVIWDPGLSDMELRVLDRTIVAPADSTAQVWITAIVWDQTGVAKPGEEIAFSTKPLILVGLPENGISDENGQVIFRLLLRVPADTTNFIFEAQSGKLLRRLTLTLIGE